MDRWKNTFLACASGVRTIFERIGLAERTAPPPQAVDLAIADIEQLPAIFPRLALWGVKRVTLVAGEDPDSDDLLGAVRLASKSGMLTCLRGRATVLAQDRLLADLVRAGVTQIEVPVLSAIAEVHDALAGVGDYRCLLRTMDTLAKLKSPPVAEIVLTPSTWKTIERTLELLADRSVRELRVFAVACRDEEPSSWAMSPGELLAAASWLENKAADRFQFTWYPPLRFDPARTLAQQVRRGPRTAANSMRIEPDGRVLPPTGPATPLGNLLEMDWKGIARGELYRAWRQRRVATSPCGECPGLKACAGGCLREAGNWAEE